MENHNDWCGELLAISEFNSIMELRKISPHRFMREKRLFKRASWISHMYTLHVLDHPRRAPDAIRPIKRVVLGNPYLHLKTKEE